MTKTQKNKNGITSFAIAAANGHLDVCKMIMEHIKNIKSRDIEGNTALHWAARNGNLEICELIIDK